jgi:hypothetical protein
MMAREEYKGHVISLIQEQYHIHKGTISSFTRGDLPPFWRGYINTMAGAKRMVDVFVKEEPQTVPSRSERLFIKPKTMPFEARLVTINNLEEIARWCNGAVKGTKLPAEQRIIQWYEQNTIDGGHELEVRVGCWLVKWGSQGFHALTNEQLHKHFTIVDKSTTVTYKEMPDDYTS